MEPLKNIYPQLSQAPIMLAILEIKFQASLSVTNSSLKSLKAIFKDDFPNHQILQHHNLELSRTNSGKTSISVKNTQDQGQLFVSKSKKHEFTISNDTFNFKQHGEYKDWISFKTFALDAFTRCFDHINPSQITRISVRYINKIELPFGENSRRPQSDFFKTFIAHTGSLLNRPLSQNSIRYTHVDESSDITVNFAQELQVSPPEIENPKLNFLIDIDVLFTKDVKPDSAFIAEKLDELRNIKNEYFFENLTDYTLNILK